MTDTGEADGRTQRRVENAARIFDSAMALLGRRPYPEVTVDEICDAAGVGRATFFRIFESKAGLLREFNRRLAASVQASVRDEAPGDATEALGIVAREIAAAWDQAGPGAAEMARDFIRSPVGAHAHAAHSELLDVVVEIVERGTAEGELSGALPARLSGALALSHIASAAAYWFEHRDRALKELADGALDAWLRGSLVAGRARAASRPPMEMST